MPPSRPSSAELAQRTWLLAWEAGTVILLRSWIMFAGGSRAAQEGQRMIDEKVAASLTLLPALIRGGLPTSPAVYSDRALAHYAAPVRANRRRLSNRA